MTKTVKLHAILVCVLLVSVAHATLIPHTIYGYAKNYEGVVLVGATVGAINQNTSESLSASTASDGSYVIELANMPSGYQNAHIVLITASYGGYTANTTVTVNTSLGLQKADDILLPVVFTTPAPAPVSGDGGAPAPTPTPTLTPVLQAEFNISNLSITPIRAGINETVLITINVTNAGNAEGTYTAKLKINDVLVEKKNVTLTAGASTNITFTFIPSSEGSYVASVDGLSEIFAVLQPSEQEPYHKPALTQVPLPIELPPVLATTPAPTATKPAQKSWMPGFEILLALVALLSLAYLIRGKPK